MGVLQDDLEGDVGAVPTCRRCGSEQVVRDAWAAWNAETGMWELREAFDQEFCLACEAETRFLWKRAHGTGRAAIRELNDAFRRGSKGMGSVLITAGIQSKGRAFAEAAFKAVQSFDGFSEDNDPWGEHDFGAVEIEEQKVFWKIDCYDLTRTTASPNPANPGVTHRVLTIMLASEY